MHIFISAGEPSGDLHGSNLIHSIKQLRSDVEFVGFGGEHMEAAGCRLLYPLARLAVVGFVRIFASMHTFLKLLHLADRYFKEHRPDAVVLIDFPGFNWWIARRAHAHGIPVFYFVPPQLWRGWRVRKMRRYVDHVLCTLPFEEPWYRARGVQAQFVGHPYFDELRQQQLDETFVERHRHAPIVGLLPGSRTHEVRDNIEMLLRTAERVQASRPDCRFMVACYRPDHGAYVEEKLRERAVRHVEVHVRKTPEIIHLSTACVAVSGSVSLELLYRGKPSIVIYQVNRAQLYLDRWFRTCRYISLVNLLADRELFPEFLTAECKAELIGRQILQWLNDEEAYRGICRQLVDLRERVAEVGACRRAAQYLVNNLDSEAGNIKAA